MEDKVIIDSRKLITIFGATKVISSTLTQAVVEINDATMIISGSNMEVVKLNLDDKEVEFSGEIKEVKYSHKQEKTSFLKRIFK